MAQVKIKFIEDYTVKDEEAKKFKEGKSYTLNEASAGHFISRGVAILVTSKAKKKATKPDPEPDPEPEPEPEPEEEDEPSAESEE